MQIESLMQTLEKFFQKWPVSHFGFIGTFIYLICFLISIILHSITIPVDWTKHFVSNMGIGPNNSPVAFSIGLIFLGIMIIPFFINLTQQLWIPTEERVKYRHARIMNQLDFSAGLIAMISIPGLIVIAFCNMSPDTIVPHAIGAMLFFFGTVIYGSIYSIILDVRKKSHIGLRISFYLVIIFFLGFLAAGGALIIMHPEEFQLFMVSPMQYAVRILGDSTDTKLAIIRVFEWLYILAMNLWCINLSIASYKIAQNKRKMN